MDRKFVEKAVESGMWNLVLVSLISSDTLINVESCKRSIDLIEELLKEVPMAEIPEDEKERSLGVLQEGLAIAKRDLAAFQNRENSD